jgi:hypothetical protein
MDWNLKSNQIHLTPETKDSRDQPSPTSVDQTAQHLLATTPVFEENRQNSMQNPLYSLQFLAQLGELTRKSLEIFRHPILKTEAPKPSQAGSLSKSKPDLKEKNLLESLQELRKSRPSFKKTTAHTTTILKAHPK